MKKFIVLMSLLGVSLGMSGDASKNPFWDNDGNLKDEYVVIMQEEWCEHNKGRDFTIDRCD